MVGGIPRSILPFLAPLCGLMLGGGLLITIITYAVSDHFLNKRTTPTKSQCDSYQWIQKRFLSLFFIAFGLTIPAVLIQYFEPNLDVAYGFLIAQAIFEVYGVSIITYGLNLEQHFGTKALMPKPKKNNAKAQAK